MTLKKRILSTALAVVTILTMSVGASAQGVSDYTKQIEVNNQGYYVVAHDADVTEKVIEETISSVLSEDFDEMPENSATPRWNFDEYIVKSKHTCSPMGPYWEVAGGWNEVYYSDGTLWFRFCLIKCKVSSCEFLAEGIMYA